MSTELDIIADFDRYYNEAYYSWNALFPFAERDLRFYMGDQWDEREKRELFQEGRSTFVFNKVRRTINLITGYQRKNRLSSVVVPIENSDQKTADQLSQLLLYSMQYGDGYQTISDCFSGACKTGWNLLSLWVDYRDDPVNGEIKFGREPYNGFILDPYFTKMDLSDCSYLMRRKYLSVEHVSSLLPGMEKEVYALWRIGWERDDKFTWLPYQRQPNGQELMAYNEFYLQKWRNVPMLVDMETGETLEMEFDKETLKMFTDKYPQLQVIQRPKRYMEMHVIVNDSVMFSQMDPYGLDDYPFVPFISYFEPESAQWGLKVQSVVRNIIDPQREINRRYSQMSDMLDSQINSGWIANENSVINPRSLFQSAQGKVIWKREDAPPGSLEKIPPAQIPPSMFQLKEMFDKDLMDIAGVNDAAFGQTENAQESGVMMMLRQSAAIVNLQDLFDNLRYAQRQVSQKVLKLIQQWTPEKVKRILHEEPTKEFYDKNFTKYDIDVQEGILTDTQRQMYFRQLVDLRQLGVPVTGEMLAAAAPIQGKSQLVDDLAKMEKQQAAAAQQQQQMQQQLMDSQRQQAQANTVANLALGKERFTRAVANLGLEDERASKAVEDRANSALSRVRAIKELQSMDDDRIFKYMNLIQQLEELSRSQEQEVKKDDIVVSALANKAEQNLPQGMANPQQLPIPQGVQQ